MIERCLPTFAGGAVNSALKIILRKELRLIVLLIFLIMVNELEWIQISHFHGITEEAVTYRVKALNKVVYSMKYHYFIGLLHSTEKSL